jgi:hypothetical protein
MALVGLLIKAIGLGTILIVTQYILAYLQSPLKKIQTHIETQRRLHKKHGDIVRLGPTTVSIADASLIKTIYNTRGTFLKSDFYR